MRPTAPPPTSSREENRSTQRWSNGHYTQSTKESYLSFMYTLPGRLKKLCDYSISTLESRLLSVQDWTGSTGHTRNRASHSTGKSPHLTREENSHRKGPASILPHHPRTAARQSYRIEELL